MEKDSRKNQKIHKFHLVKANCICSSGWSSYGLLVGKLIEKTTLI